MAKADPKLPAGWLQRQLQDTRSEPATRKAIVTTIRRKQVAQMVARERDRECFGGGST